VAAHVAYLAIACPPLDAGQIIDKGHDRSIAVLGKTELSWNSR